MDQKTLARWLKAVIIGTGICGLVVFLWCILRLNSAFFSEIQST